MHERAHLRTSHGRSKRYGRSGFGRTTFWPMTTPTITSTLCACSEFFNRGHRASERCRCFVGEMDCVIPSQPHQPPASFTFPKRSFRKKAPVLRSFQHAWFKQWTFLHYNEDKDLEYCHTCLLCFKEEQLRSANADPAFVSSLNYVNNLIWITNRSPY